MEGQGLAGHLPDDFKRFGTTGFHSDNGPGGPCCPELTPATYAARPLFKHTDGAPGKKEGKRLRESERTWGEAHHGEGILYKLPLVPTQKMLGLSGWKCAEGPQACGPFSHGGDSDLRDGQRRVAAPAERL